MYCALSPGRYISLQRASLGGFNEETHFQHCSLDLCCCPSNGTPVEADDSLNSLLHLATHKNGLGSNEHQKVRDLEHSFSYDLDEMRKLASLPACILIAHHGSFHENPQGWNRIPLGFSTWPIYADPNVRVTSFAKKELALILSGRISTWDELGGSRHRITVVMHQGIKYSGFARSSI